jgi:hypothetical protein
MTPRWHSYENRRVALNNPRLEERFRPVSTQVD